MHCSIISQHLRIDCIQNINIHGTVLLGLILEKEILKKVNV